MVTDPKQKTPLTSPEDEPRGKKPDASSASKTNERQDRLAKALRDNLKKRKAQARSREND